MTNVFAYIAVFAGFVAISLSMKRYRAEVVTAGQKTGLRCLGFLCLALGGFICVQNLGLGVGLTVWFGMMTFTAFLYAMLLSFYPGWILGIRKSRQHTGEAEFKESSQG